MRTFGRNIIKPVHLLIVWNTLYRKSDDNARMQMKVIGWDKDTQMFLLDALRRMEDAARDSYRWSK